MLTIEPQFFSIELLVNCCPDASHPLSPFSRLSIRAWMAPLKPQSTQSPAACAPKAGARKCRTSSGSSPISKSTDPPSSWTRAPTSTDNTPSPFGVGGYGQILGASGHSVSLRGFINELGIYVVLDLLKRSKMLPRCQYWELGLSIMAILLAVVVVRFCAIVRTIANVLYA